MTRVLLAGNPNCGKTTLFNALTGDNQRVGNWPGVTVAKKTGQFLLDQDVVDVTDLPGVYSLSFSSGSGSQDELIAARAIVALDVDVIVNVIDACHLERHLYLTSQLLELGKPVIVALNMMDIAEQRGITIDMAALSSQLNCSVLPLQAHKKIGLDALRQAICNLSHATEPLALNLPSSAVSVFTALSRTLMGDGQLCERIAQYYAWRVLEGDTSLPDALDVDVTALLHDADEDMDVLLADARYREIHRIVSVTQTRRSDASEHVTAKIDRVVLHRFWALPIFFGMMYMMFLFAINIGGAFQDFFDISTDTIFVQGSAWLLQQWHAPQWSIALIANGIGKGINTTLTFIPVMAGMFFFLSLLEASGYMARAAFVVDKVMRAMGLPGKSFVPMIVGFGCNVPAIMAARTLDSERDRLLTVLMSPFMSCSARLAIYAVFVAAFFPTGGQNVVFALYLIGILMAVFTGFILRKTTLQGESSPLILELPAYHKPSFKRLWREMGLRLRYFIVRAGRLIIPVCIILGGLNALTIDGGLSSDEASANSVLSLLGQWLTPVFSPMGLHQDNWPATVGLLTGMLAKEVVVGSLNSLYAQLGQIGQMQGAHFDFLGSLAQAVWSVPQNLAALGSALFNPVMASAPDSELSQSVYGMMARRFDGQAGAFAYLLFILLYIPCVSTMAAIRQEANRSLMWFSVIWSFIIAYVAAVIFYQAATFSLHPQQSAAWIGGALAGILFFIGLLRYRGLRLGGTRVIANS
ncbi:Fe(2+) transporter permease subunit FeoB [Legionella spiritensis]|uniref:Ferrous iron transport protein B n=1 Tax=Legionella spiritensis TaxID=452 RepID=A0A0W0Z6B8_LEGSP|nr:Fe(2+) transporter permease subunit FeoB [Legionella spiritensis]KTD64692.1 ferrous iron transport protein B [Legionella spiritensis]SNV47906.1 ferrous iron transport protein B [Legionella spiritensis]